ncbi:Acid phosphatase soluble [Brachionus plicatilis]|uniref:Low molecular weight phosphotyrosine protein phosphatase n=1 Tax=Brachionus plicatilis TaxID=10195 RepID=A0A3M7RDI5_BRAPC|nr:Acid phosphatase soluble [Brachionus plicatilis]
MTKHSVLFVCLGNICRSPMGEAILHDLATKQGVRDNWLIDSAGTGGHEAGSRIYSGAQRVLKKYGINYEHIARQITPQDFDKFDLILGFDVDNIRNLERIKPKNSKAEIKLVNFFNEKRKNKNIEDPWYPDTNQAFEAVYTDCLEACKTLLNEYK